MSGGTTGTGTAVATDDGYAFWDGDDMTIEMVTDLDDGNVDEEVSFPPSPIDFFAAILTGVRRWKRRFRPSWPCTHAKSCTTNVF